MNIKVFKEEYVEKCTEVGLYGKDLRKLIKATPIISLIYVIASFIFAANQMESQIYLTAGVMFTYFFILYLLTRKKVQNSTGKKIKGLKLCTPEIQKELDSAFKDLMRQYKINSHDEKSEKRLDDIVRILNNYSDRLKYDWLIPSKILVFLLPGLWAVLLVLDEKISIINDLIAPIKQNSIISNLLGLTLIVGIFLMINWLVGRVILNSSSDEYKELANKVDEYRLDRNQ